MFTPSEYQKRIFEFGDDPDAGNGSVNAVAGSGKTTTLEHFARRRTGESGVSCAFNKHIAATLNEKLAGTSFSAATINSLAYRACRNVWKRTDVEARKYLKIFDTMVEEDRRKRALPEASKAEMQSLIMQGSALLERARISRLDPSSASNLDAVSRSLQLDYDEVFRPWLYEKVQDAAKRGREMAPSMVDFTDQVCLPIEMELPVQQYPWTLVDEAQDLSPAQQDFVAKLVAPGGRILAVGDPNQAIYGFAGADRKSFERLAERFSTKQLPLSICYRCPTSHIAIAQSIVPRIEAAHGAQAGVAEVVSLAKLNPRDGRDGKEGDLIIGRTTAPLVQLCFHLIRSGKRAKVRGRDIGANITEVVKKISKKDGFSYRDFRRFLGEWQMRMLEKAKDDDREALKIKDLASTVSLFYTEADGARTVEQLCKYIENFFSDDIAGCVLSTVHKAKGLEADRVFIFCPGLMPHPMAQEGEDKEQEWNLAYVAVTRSKSYLGIIEGTFDQEDKMGAGYLPEWLHAGMRGKSIDARRTAQPLPWERDKD